MAIEKNLFGQNTFGEIYEYVISRKNLSVGILNYGGIVRFLKVQTSQTSYDIALGYNTLKEYENDNGTYFGALIGRVANRIANGKFLLNGKEYTLYKNNDTNCLHGGRDGFNVKTWQARILDGYSLELSYLSRDGEENFPSNLQVKVIYSLTERGGLKIEYLAEADADTPVNLTNHTYFNLNGEGSGDVLGHELTLFADQITPVNANMVPTGEFMPVKGTAFDFLTPKTIGKDINNPEEQLAICGGYDVNFVKTVKGNELIAQARGEKSGITMQVYTTEQGVQFYSGELFEQCTRQIGRLP